jgi:hypothetical protein
VNDYVDLSSLGQTVLFSVLAVLTVTGSFAVGARSYVSAEGARAAARPAFARMAVAVVCFVIAAAGVVVGVWFILDK